MTTAQKKLAAKHGTPNEHERQVWLDFQAGKIPIQEAFKLADKYRKMWSEAGQVSRDLEAEIIDETPGF